MIDMASNREMQTNSFQIPCQKKKKSWQTALVKMWMWIFLRVQVGTTCVEINLAITIKITNILAFWSTKFTDKIVSYRLF